MHFIKYLLQVSSKIPMKTAYLSSLNLWHAHLSWEILSVYINSSAQRDTRPALIVS